MYITAYDAGQLVFVYKTLVRLHAETSAMWLQAALHLYALSQPPMRHGMCSFVQPQAAALFMERATPAHGADACRDGPFAPAGGR